jgi:hypothetical protein
MNQYYCIYKNRSKIEYFGFIYSVNIVADIIIEQTVIYYFGT